ncbi:MAG TPA: beta-galactosidase [Chloroflexota bacterium]|nr:beta-galactosidase [Chloroflexota bacterium]
MKTAKLLAGLLIIGLTACAAPRQSPTPVPSTAISTSTAVVPAISATAAPSATTPTPEVSVTTPIAATVGPSSLPTANPSPSPVPPVDATTGPGLTSTAVPSRSPISSTTAVPVASLTPASRSSGPLKQTRGIYAVLKHDRGASLATLSNPNADGIVVRTYWSSVEPTEGQYDWSFLDSQVAGAAAHGKQVVMIVLPGAFTPTWALQGVQTAQFDSKYGFTRGRPLTLPIPWDQTYLNRWFAFVRTLGERYDSNPAVVLVPATGPTSVSAEMSLPDQSDAVAQWRTLGYTPQKFEDAWRQTLATYAQAFPTTQSALIMYPGLPIPDSAASDQTRSDLVALAVNSYPGRVAIQTSGLSARKQDHPTLGYTLVQQSSPKTIVGFEMGTSATEKPARMGNANPVVALQDSIDFGLKAGANYLEIYEADVNNPAMQSALRDARAALPSQRG